MFANLFSEDMMIVVVIALVLFGAGQLPKIARNLGEAQKELKRAMRDDDDVAPAAAAAPTPVASVDPVAPEPTGPAGSGTPGGNGTS